MNRRVTIIIATDFFCWVPFIIICVVHSLEILDATRWYSVLSLAILPINSVINPFLYDDTIVGPLSALFGSISTRVVDSIRRENFITRNTTQSSIIEMDVKKVQCDPVSDTGDYKNKLSMKGSQGTMIST